MTPVQEKKAADLLPEGIRAISTHKKGSPLNLRMSPASSVLRPGLDPYTAGLRTLDARIHRLWPQGGGLKKIL